MKIYSFFFIIIRALIIGKNRNNDIEKDHLCRVIFSIGFLLLLKNKN
jgi:hypothetical protein